MTRLKKKNLEFIRAARRRTSVGIKRILTAAVCLLLPTALALSAVGHTLWQWEQIRQMESEADELDAYLNQKDIRLANAEVYALSQDMKLMDDYLSNMERARDILNSYPTLDEKTSELLTAPGEVAIEEIRLEGDTLKFTAVAEDYREAAPYIEKLEESGRFEHVVYEGFELTDRYRFRITCRLRNTKEQQGRQEHKGDS